MSRHWNSSRPTNLQNQCRLGYYVPMSGFPIWRFHAAHRSTRETDGWAHDEGSRPEDKIPREGHVWWLGRFDSVSVRVPKVSSLLLTSAQQTPDDKALLQHHPRSHGPPASWKFHVAETVAPWFPSAIINFYPVGLAILFSKLSLHLVSYSIPVVLYTRFVHSTTVHIHSFDPTHRLPNVFVDDVILPDRRLME